MLVVGHKVFGGSNDRGAHAGSLQYFRNFFGRSGGSPFGNIRVEARCVLTPVDGGLVAGGGSDIVPTHGVTQRFEFCVVTE